MRVPSLRATLVSAVLAASVAVPLLSSEPVAAAPILVGPPDLTTVLSASPNPVGVGGIVAYTISIGNSTAEVCSKTYPEPICHQAGKAVSNVSVSMTIPAGWSYYAGIGDHNFSCPFVVSGNLATCFGGSLGADDWATVTIWLTAPSASGTFGVTANVDPSNAIAERSETNNQATVNVTVNAPTPKADLVISNITGPGSASRGGQATYTATISNLGQATANGVNLVFTGAHPTWSLASSSGAAGLTPCLRTFNEVAFEAHCPSLPTGGITLAPGQSVSVSVVAQIPTTAPSGPMLMMAKGDPYNQVAESNESNNNSSNVYTYVN